MRVYLNDYKAPYLVQITLISHSRPMLRDVEPSTGTPIDYRHAFLMTPEMVFRYIVNIFCRSYPAACDATKSHSTHSIWLSQLDLCIFFSTHPSDSERHPPESVFDVQWPSCEPLSCFIYVLYCIHVRCFVSLVYNVDLLSVCTVYGCIRPYSMPYRTVRSFFFTMALRCTGSPYTVLTPYIYGRLPYTVRRAALIGP
jgi:hypothetical protein